MVSACSVLYSTPNGKKPFGLRGTVHRQKKAKKEGYPDENLGTGLPEINPLRAMAQMRTVHTVGID